ncbi:hypothetical protein ABTY61_22875 [Kitasatospora sp. NPDC096128]|uniref:hypothetical protein n=1 Tax=Kitasatospora sp. NPDC096128 TaxID=3155547 RepID=UPI00331F00E4
MLVMRSGAVVMAKRPSKPAISAMVANLQRGRSLILERLDEEPGDWYVQVWVREDNTFQLEYRDGVPAEHFQMWNNIGSWFGTGS